MGDVDQMICCCIQTDELPDICLLDENYDDGYNTSTSSQIHTYTDMLPVPPVYNTNRCKPSLTMRRKVKQTVKNDQPERIKKQSRPSGYSKEKHRVAEKRSRIKMRRAFNSLRDILGADRNLSRIDTIDMAIAHIQSISGKLD